MTLFRVKTSAKYNFSFSLVEEKCTKLKLYSCSFASDDVWQLDGSLIKTINIMNGYILVPPWKLQVSRYFKSMILVL